MVGRAERGHVVFLNTDNGMLVQDLPVFRQIEEIPYRLLRYRYAARFRQRLGSHPDKATGKVS